MRTFSLRKLSERLFALILITAFFVFFGIFGMSMDPPFSIPDIPADQQPELLQRILHGGIPIGLFFGVLYLLISFNRVTTVDPAEQQIRIRDYIFFFLPYRTQTFAFYEVLTVDCKRETDADHQTILRVSIVMAGKQIEIMSRSRRDFNECLKSARLLAKMTSSPFKHNVS